MSNRTSRRQAQHAQALKKVRSRLTIAAFAAGAILILGIAFVLATSPLRAARGPAAVADGHQLIITMAGFTPPNLRVPAGRPFTVRLVNTDSSYHTDGGGWHQFRVERLGIDVRIPPRSEQIQTFEALAPGTYEFYCDVCCGGKENPSMRGVIEVNG